LGNYLVKGKTNKDCIKVKAKDGEFAKEKSCSDATMAVCEGGKGKNGILMPRWRYWFPFDHQSQPMLGLVSS
jgi:hypothetical protein